MGLLLAICLAAPASPRQAEAWNRVIAALQLVGEENFEALELSPSRSRRRRLELAALLRDVEPLAPDPEIRAEVRAIRRRLPEGDAELGVSCRALVRKVLDRAPIHRAPREKPDLDRGKRLYARACAACHGKDGSGGSPIAATLDPPPPDILHPRQSWNPWDMFTRITYGGAQTAMPSFKDGLSEMQRWDIVFYLFAERWPPCAAPLPSLRADELAVLGDYELGNRFGYGSAACLRRDFLPPPVSPAPAREGSP